MFRTTITLVSPTLTFSTVDEYLTELEQYFDEAVHDAGVLYFEGRGMLLRNDSTLIDESTIQTIREWDSEESYLDFYSKPNGIQGLAAIEAAGYVRTVVEETI